MNQWELRGYTRDRRGGISSQRKLLSRRSQRKHALDNFLLATLENCMVYPAIAIDDKIISFPANCSLIVKPLGRIGGRTIEHHMSGTGSRVELEIMESEQSYKGTGIVSRRKLPYKKNGDASSLEILNYAPEGDQSGSGIACVAGGFVCFAKNERRSREGIELGRIKTFLIPSRSATQRFDSKRAQNRQLHRLHVLWVEC